MRNSVLGGIAVVIIAAAAFLFFRAPSGAPTQPSEVSSSDSGAVSSTTPVEGTPGMVAVDDQPAGATVTVKLVSFEKPGFLTIHEQTNGNPGAVTGVSVLLPKGSSTNVVVPVSPSTVVGKSYFAMLHSDDGDGAYQFPGPDGPLLAADGALVMMKFTISGASAGTAVDVGVNAGTTTDVLAGAAATLTLSMDSGNFFYKPDNFKAKVNQPVTVNFINSGFHTFTIDALGVNQTITGTTGSVTFTPTKKGTFEFYCAIGNHKAMGMKGTLVVE
ncbi:cupredoxin domain-containing protein [Candidatus Uhrbacteria bacterium]|nr:cupredoxin domain-containing protein [Candidatus Uhrbacteria bacterium]